MANVKESKKVQTQEEFEKGRQLSYDASNKYSEGDIDGAVKLWQEARVLGDVEATFTLGVLHLQGIGVEADQLKADECFEYVANQEGNNPKIAQSQYFLGLHSQHGVEQDGKVVVPQDFKKAYYWYDKAAHRNHAEAMFAYALANLRAEGTKENREEGMRYLFMSAGLENPDANNYVSSYYNQLMAETNDLEEKKEYMLKATYYMRRGARLGDEMCKKTFEKLEAQGQYLPSEEETSNIGLMDMVTVLDEIQANFDRLDKEQEVLNKKYSVKSTWEGKPEKKSSAKAKSSKTTSEKSKAAASKKTVKADDDVKEDKKEESKAKTASKNAAKAVGEEKGKSKKVKQEEVKAIKTKKATESAGKSTDGQEADEAEVFANEDEAPKGKATKEEVRDLLYKIADDEVEITEELASDVLKKIEESGMFDEDEEEKEVEEVAKKRSGLSVDKLIKKGDAAVNKNNFAKAFEYLEEAYDLGSAAAGIRLADLYSQGLGVEQDYQKVIDIYTQIALREDEDENIIIDDNTIIAEFNLGVMHTKGITGHTDERLGMMWLKKAADHGYAPAQHTFGYFLEKGQNGLKVNLKMAEVYYLRAAVQEHVDAMSQLVMLYSNYEEYSEKEDSLLKTLYWLANAGSKGNKQCEKILEDYWKEMGDEFPSSDACIEATKLDIENAILANEERKVEKIEDSENPVLKTASKKATNSKKATKSENKETGEVKVVSKGKKKSAKQNKADEPIAVDEDGNPLTEDEVKSFTLVSEGLKEFRAGNKEKGITMWTEAVGLGNPDAAFNLAICYENGDGVPQDLKKSFELYLFAASHEEINKYNSVQGAQFNVGNGYYNGCGVEQDFKKAYEWYEKAANNGQVTAQYNLGYSYVTGQHIPQDVEKGFKYLEMAADNGFALAQSMLGLLYYKGLGTDADLEKAKHYYTLAANQGDEQARGALKEIESAENGGLSQEELAELKGVFKDVKVVNDPEEMKDVTFATMDNLAEVVSNLEAGDSKKQQAKAKSQKAFVKKTLAAVYGRKKAHELTHVEDYSALDNSDISTLASLGDPEAQWVYGDKCIAGSGSIEQNVEKAVKYYAKSYACGSSMGTYRLATCYIQGVGVEKDEFKGASLMANAAEKGNIDACRYMVNYHNKNQDRSKAMPYIEIIADKTGDNDCQILLANAYINAQYGYKKNEKKGLGYALAAIKEVTEPDDIFSAAQLALKVKSNTTGKKIVSRLEYAGNKGHFDALVTAASLYISGERGIEKDLKKAYALLQKAEKLIANESKGKDKKDNKGSKKEKKVSDDKGVEVLKAIVEVTEMCPYCKKMFTKIYKLGFWDKVPYCSKCGRKWPKIPKDLLKKANNIKFL